MTEPSQTSELARAVQDVTERAQLIVREEVELAKAEISLKVSKLLKGVAVAAAAGVFVGAACVMLLHSIAWLVYRVGPWGDSEIWLGFLVTAGGLLALAAIAAYLAYRWLRTGPPTPDMAIHEAQLIRETVSGHSGRS